MKKNIPVYEFIIDETDDISGVKCVSLVEDPAMMTNFIAFENQEIKQKYIKFQDYEQVVFGIAMQPDFPIYRIDEFGKEYYGVFTKSTIKKMVHKFHKEQQTKNVNLDHNEQNYVDAYMFSDYIVDSELQVEDLKSKGIPDAKIGSWIVAYKIENKNVFEKVLSGEFNGFSIESYLDRMLIQMNKNKNNKMNKTKKSLLQKIAQMFTDKSIVEEIMNAETFERALVPELGFEIEWQEVGQPVNQVVVSPEGVETMAPVGPGEFKTDAGVVVVDDASNLVEVRELPVEPEVPVETPVEEPMSEDELAKKKKCEEEVALVDPPMPEVPVEEVPAEPTVDVKTKTIGEVVGEMDGEYWVKVVVEGGVVTEAEVSSETDLLKQKMSDLEKKNAELEEKLKEPIGEPILEPEKIVKPFAQMSAYEKALQKAQNRA